MDGNVKDWSPAEDRRPGIAFAKQQPERTARGDVWTQIVCFELPSPEQPTAMVRGFTQMTIRDEGGTYITGNGRIYSIPMEDHDDGA